MKILAIGLMVCLGGSALAGCSTTDPSTGEGSAIAQVQTAATAVCRFLPAAETVGAIIATGDPRLATASAIARAICAALDPQGAPAGVMTLYRAGPSVNGVAIKGHFVGG